MLKGSRTIRQWGASIALLLTAVVSGCQSPSTTASHAAIPPVAAPTIPRPPASAADSLTATTSGIPGSRPLATTGEPRNRILPDGGKSLLALRNPPHLPTGAQHKGADRAQRVPADVGQASDPAIKRLRQTILQVDHHQDREEPPILDLDDAAETLLVGTTPALFPGDAKSVGPIENQVPPAPGAPLAAPTETVAPPTRIAELGLGQVLTLAGAENWAVLLADERIREAQAKHDAAKVLWLPSLNAGVGYTKHDGQIQDTRGTVIDVSRNALFVGGGAVTSDAPTTGLSGGPARMFIDLSLADAIFLPRSTKSLLNASRWARHATFNDTLLDASHAYYEVVRAQQQLALARENLKLMENLLAETKKFEASGKGTKADVSRVEVQLERRRNDVVRAEGDLQIASAELARVLRINLEGIADDIAIYAKEPQLVPVDFIPAEAPLGELTAQAVAGRPEISELYHRSQAARQKTLAEQWRPWIPNLHAGVSTGGFGGGVGSNLNGLDGRADFDLLAVWQVRNLGLGVRAARDEAASLQRQTHLEYHRVRDIIVAEVAKAHAEVKAQKRRLALARQRVEKAREAHKRSLARIRGFVGLPLEALQDVQAVIEARRELVNATVDYNRAQLKLLRAIGRTAFQPQQ